MARLEGKGAIVTGAGSGSGIGRASALLFTCEGARVIAVDRDGETAKETASLTPGKEIRAFSADVGGEAAA